MFSQIFSINKEDFHIIITIFGIKFKIYNRYMLLSHLRNKSKVSLGVPKLFLYLSGDKLTTEQKVWYLSQVFYKTVGYFPNFKTPKSFNEKLNWMKLNYYNPTENICIDKYEFKNYIKEKLGDGYTIPLIGVYEDVNDIDFDNLPEKFVIKTTTNGGGTGICIVKNKKDLDIDNTKANFNNLIQDWNKTYYSIMARGCKEIKPRIIIEEYMEQLEGELYDYKFHCFHGETKLVLGIKNRKHGKYKYRFYDKNWSPLDIYRESKKDLINLKRPKNYDKMLEISEFLSKDFPFVRVDFYEVGDKIYIGELTFTPKGAFGKYSPREWDYKMGEWLDLGNINPAYLHILPEFAESAKTFVDPEIVKQYLVKEL